MAISIAQQTNAFSDPHTTLAANELLKALRADVAAQKAAIAAITAKLDADAGVTDTNYAATCDSAALTVTN